MGALAEAKDAEVLPLPPKAGLQQLESTMIDPFMFPRLLPIAQPPQMDTNCALFLHLDGTLLDIAPTPERVTIPPGLLKDLETASARLGGAVAIVSGRILDEVDRLLSPLKLPGAGEHGAVVRMPSGQRDEVDERIPHDWITALEAVAHGKRGVIIERKPHGLVAHFRQAPRHESLLKRACQALVAEQPDVFEVIDGKMAVEIRPTRVNRGRAVRRLMETAPFKGRKPIFVGDDVMDADGFRAAEAYGGDAADVFLRFAGRPSEVRHWLKSALRPN